MTEFQACIYPNLGGSLLQTLIKDSSSTTLDVCRDPTPRLSKGGDSRQFASTKYSGCYLRAVVERAPCLPGP